MPFETKLREELDRELDSLKDSDVGSEEHKATADTMTRLMDRAIELKKIEVEARNQERAQENERALRLVQMRDERNDKLLRNILMGVGSVGGLATIWLLSAAAFTYEEKGTISSLIGKKVLGMLVPKL
jgi:hypothetical protein